MFNCQHSSKGLTTRPGSDGWSSPVQCPISCLPSCAGQPDTWQTCGSPRWRRRRKRFTLTTADVFALFPMVQLWHVIQPDVETGLVNEIWFVAQPGFQHRFQIASRCRASHLNFSVLGHKYGSANGLILTELALEGDEGGDGDFYDTGSPCLASLEEGDVPCHKH